MEALGLPSKRFSMYPNYPSLDGLGRVSRPDGLPVPVLGEGSILGVLVGAPRDGGRHLTAPGLEPVEDIPQRVDAASGPGLDTGPNPDPLRRRASRWRPVPKAARRQPPPTGRCGVSRSRDPWRPSRRSARRGRSGHLPAAPPGVASGDSSSGTRRRYGRCHGEGRLRQHTLSLTRTARPIPYTTATR